MLHAFVCFTPGVFPPLSPRHYSRELNVDRLKTLRFAVRCSDNWIGYGRLGTCYIHFTVYIFSSHISIIFVLLFILPFLLSFFLLPLPSPVTPLFLSYPSPPPPSFPSLSLSVSLSLSLSVCLSPSSAYLCL